ncbi:MAG: nicotinate (nicotinamide) nucleotide adenylyltransferase [Acidobacteria bacterium]|nr:nicotinate (nicotinamide) nucleotide adenylyltransferase [Acidobacteriota bacterium]
MRIGFFGGSFDPPHIGHLAVARAAAFAFSLDKVMFVPTALQPLKPQGAVASFTDRLQMVCLLCADQHEGSVFVASDLDAPISDGTPNYAVDTLSRTKKTLSADDSLFVILGADAFVGLRHWRASPAVLEMADWIVVSRPGFSVHSLEIPSARLDHVHLLDGVSEPASATQIRELLLRGEDCAKILTSSVYQYIHEHHLYEAPHEGHPKVNALRYHEKDLNKEI